MADGFVFPLASLMVALCSPVVSSKANDRSVIFTSGRNSLLPNTDTVLVNNVIKIFGDDSRKGWKQMVVSLDRSRVVF